MRARVLVAALLLSAASLPAQVRDTITVLAPSVQITSVGGSPFRLWVNGAEVPGRTWAAYHTAAVALDSVKKSCSWCDVRIRQTLEWTSTIRMLPYRVLGDVRQPQPPDTTQPPPPDTTPTQPPPPPQPPSAGELVFQSCWCTTALGSSQAILLDNAKWNSVVGVANATVVEAPPEWGPVPRVLRIVPDPAGRGGASIFSKSGLGEVPVGSTRNWRWFYAAYLPEVGFDCGQHPVQDGGAVSQSNWYMGTSHCGGNLRPGEWGLQFNLSGALSDWNRYKWGLWSSEGTYTIPLRKGVPYRIEVQVARVSATEMRIHFWVHDANGSLIADDRNFRGTNGQYVLSDRPLLRINSAASMGTYVAGLNGVVLAGGSWPAHHNDQAAHAIVDGLPEGTQIGAYGSVAGEVAR